MSQLVEYTDDDSEMELEIPESVLSDLTRSAKLAMALEQSTLANKGTGSQPEQPRAESQGLEKDSGGQGADPNEEVGKEDPKPNDTDGEDELSDSMVTTRISKRLSGKKDRPRNAPDEAAPLSQAKPNARTKKKRKKAETPDTLEEDEVCHPEYRHAFRERHEIFTKPYWNPDKADIEVSPWVYL